MLVSKQEPSPILVEPHFGYRDNSGLPYTPTLPETVREFLRVIDCIRTPVHSLTTINFLLQVSTGGAFIIFISYFASPGSLLFLVFGVLWLGTIYNTVWYHRYCSDFAFQFARQIYPRIFLWTNPMAFIFREEIYAIPHKIHHQRTDRPGDPYGPHLGYVASFLSPELTQRINPNITREEFDARLRGIDHIGLHKNTYAQFRRTASFENVYYYAARVSLSQSLWISIAYTFGEAAFVLAYYSAIFIATILIRDFNWRGHGGNRQGQIKRSNWEFEKKTRALNQYFYGIVASEWHDNHHHYITSAKNGFLPGQIDIAFATIKTLHRLGIVKCYINSESLFQKQCLAENPSHKQELNQDRRALSR